MKLAGFDITEVIHSVDNTVVARAIAESGDSVILKYQNAQYPSEDLNARWQHEFMVLQSIKSPWVVQARSLEKINNNMVLVLEDFSPLNLAQLMHSNRLDLTQRLRLAIQLSEALSDVHKHQLIHNDISPKNILVDIDTFRIKICDFELATQLSGQHPLGITEHVWGTLDYMSPEQSGRTNLAVDYRSDFYALGVTLYELFVGRRPFEYSDPMALLYAHLARAPEPLNAVDLSIPEQLSDIVLRLLAKSPDGRYQSSFGLQEDLIRCLKEWQTEGYINTFVTGECDRPEGFHISHKLYGREKELSDIFAAYERVCLGHSELLLVSGRSGIGKSALVNELHKPIVSKRALFIRGKCEQFTSNKPYAALIQAFQPLMCQLVSEGEEKSHYWQFILRRALADNAPVIVDLIPELEQIIGASPPLQSLPAGEAENRFHTVFRHFVGALSSSGRPLVIFLDDLQWADISTLKLLEQQIQPEKSSALLIIGAYRDNEVDNNHPLIHTLNAVKEVQGEVHNLKLSNLDLTQVAELISDTLLCECDDVDSLARLCHEKTEGNPFFLSQFLTSLYDEGEVAYDYDKGAWVWDVWKIEQRQITDNVVEFMMEKLCKLDERTQQLISLASLLGESFTLRLLSIVCEQSPTQTSRALWPLLQQGLILPLNENYKFSDAPDRLVLTQYQFLHDRVQQAAYTLIKHEERPSVMLNAGRLLLARMDKMPQVVQEKHLFTILGLINDSYHLITDAVEQVQLLELNIRGGVKARNASAYPAAISFFSIAKAMLPENVWQEEPEQALLVYQALAESLYLAGEFEAADALYPIAIRVANNALAKVSLMLIQATQYQQQTRFTEALPVLVEGLALLGFDFPSLEEQAEVLLPEFFLMTLQTLNSHSEEQMFGMAEMMEPHYLQAMELHNVLTVVLYQLRMFNAYAVNSCQMLKLSFDHGHCDLTPLAYLTSAWAMSMMGEPYTRCYDVGRLSLTLVDQRENRYHRVLIYQGFAAFFQHWGEPLENTLPLLEKAVRWGQEGLNFTSAGHAVLLGGVNKFICGVKLRTLEIESSSGLAFLRRSHQSSTANFVKFSTLQPSLALQGKTLHPISFDTKSVDVTGFFDGDYTTPSMELALFSQAMIRHAFIMKARVQQQRFIQNLSIIEVCLPHSPSFSESLFFTTLILIESIALADVASSQCGDKISNNDIEEKRALVKEYACRFKQWSDGCPETYRHKYLMIEAEIASLAGDGSRAMDCYALAIEDAKKMGFIQCEAIANELYAQYWLQNGQKQIAVHLIRESYYLYQCWGAKVKCDLLELHWPYVSFALEERVQAYGNPLKTVTTVTHQTDVLDLHSLLKANQLLSEELGLESLLRRMMEVLLENSGAEKCGIIVLDEGQLVVEMVGKFDNKSQELDCQRYGKTLQWVCTGDAPLLPDALIHHVHKTLSTLVLTRPIKDPYFSYNTYFQEYDPKSVMCLPILYQGNMIAVIYLENNLMEGAFTTRHKETLTLLSTQLAISLINAMLYDKMEMKVALRTEELRQIAMKDGLTNIANRRSFDERLQGEWRRSLRNGKPLSLLMIDIDFFKQYNDGYGHLVGDECIKAVAHTLSLSAPRAMDFVARYGGEEFCVLLSESDQDMALLVALTCLDAVRNLALPHKQSSVESYVTISVGVSTLVAVPNMPPCTLMANADEALYSAKNNGRNCVIVHESAEEGAAKG